jgi:hypothetical protein
MVGGLLPEMKKKERQAIELEAELLRLNAMVRKRRDQLARLEKCPHKDCECRAVWREVVEKDLASQVGKISHGVRNGASHKLGAEDRTHKTAIGLRKH